MMSVAYARGSDTSAAAASSMVSTVDQLRARVFDAIRARSTHGATCDEIEVGLELKHQTASARINELKEDHQIADSGERRLTRSGRKAVVWMTKADIALQPPLKWAGGKRWLVPRLRELYTVHRHRRLVEPFVGGMSVALGLRPERALLTDINMHLINYYVRLRDTRSFTIAMENDETFYYHHRAIFNALIALPGGQFSPDAAELFYYLNRTGFNGLCRFNQSGEFNVPFGSFKTINYRRDFSEYAPLLRKWTLACHSFEACRPDPEDFVYLDPPYDETFADYSAGGFSWEQQEQLAVQFATHGGPVVVSNAATPRVLELYQRLGYSVMTLPAPRRIAANGDREQALEMLATRNLVLPIQVSVSAIATVTETATDNEGDEQMAFLPKGYGRSVAKAEATVPRQQLKDGDYVFLHKAMFSKKTKAGEAIIIEHKIVEAKAITAGIEPTPVGTSWGYFLPQYGDAAVMCEPNLKAYVLGLLGVDPKKVSDEALGDTIDDIGGEKQLARGMLIRGVTFHTNKKDGDDFMGVNWFPVVGENMPNAPGVLKRRAELDAETGGQVPGAAPSPAAAPPVGVPALPVVGAPPAIPGAPPPVVVDPVQAAIAQGWQAHPQAPGWFWHPGLPQGSNMKSEADLRAGR